MLYLANLYPPVLIDLPTIVASVPDSEDGLGIGTSRTLHSIFHGLEEVSIILLPDSDRRPFSSGTLEQLYLLTEFLLRRVEELKH